MKRLKRKPERGKPLQVKAGSASVKIYHNKNRGRDIYTVSYYSPTGKRMRLNFADPEKARTEADRKAASIQTGDLEVLKLSNKDHAAYKHAQELLLPFSCGIDIAVSEYATARKVLGTGGSVIEAARFYAKHHPTQLPKKPLKAVVDELIEAKRQDGMSARYLEDLESRLGRFSSRFQKSISEFSTKDVQDWLASLGVGARGRNNFRSVIVLLFNFSKQRGYLPKNQPTEADALSKAKDVGSPIGIFTPAELGKLLNHADESLVPYFAIGAFAGLRTAELQRLTWEEIKFEQGYIEVTAGKAKTAQRRLIPIQPNLKEWLKPFSDRTGLVCHLHTINQKASSHARDLGLQWPHNALRHSFASYRLTECKSAAQVALEMGNSPRMVFQHYRELVTEADAKMWWSIAPPRNGKVIHLSASAA